MRNWHWNWLERKPEDADKGGDYGLYKRNITRTSRYPLAGIPANCLKVMKRILRMAGLPDDRDSGYLEFLALRKYTPEQRISIVEQAIYHSPDIGLVIIDGIRDMVYDINSPGESTRIISKLMQWTDDRQIHIHTILHQNKGDENARGHISGAYHHAAQQTDDSAGKRQEVFLQARLPLLADNPENRFTLFPYPIYTTI